MSRDSVDVRVKTRFPAPLAEAWARVSARDPAEAIRQLRNFHDVLARVLFSFLLCDHLGGQCSGDIARAIANKPQPSLGALWFWISKLLSHAEKHRSTACFFPEALLWHAEWSPEGSEVRKLIEGLAGIRNEEAHRPPRQAEMLLDGWRGQTLELLRSLWWLGDYRLTQFSVRDIENEEAGGARYRRYRGTIRFFTGNQSEVPNLPASWTAEVDTKSLYLHHREGRVLRVDPFLRAYPDGVYLFWEHEGEDRIILHRRGEPQVFKWSDSLPFKDRLRALAGKHAWQTDLSEGALAEEDDSRWEWKGRIGEGATSVVYAAVDKLKQEACALKLLKPGYSAGGPLLARLRREARIMSAARHPNILQAELHQTNRGLALAMPLCRTTLETILEERRLTEREALEYAEPVLSALALLHASGVIHRDLKPSNVLIDNKGQVRLADFGIALQLEATRLTRQDFRMGTFTYMAPEQLNGEDATEASDVYAAAVVIHELATGSVHTDHPGEGLSGPLAELLADMSAQGPGERPSARTARERVTALLTADRTPPESTASKATTADHRAPSSVDAVSRPREEERPSSKSELQPTEPGPRTPRKRPPVSDQTTGRRIIHRAVSPWGIKVGAAALLVIALVTVLVVWAVGSSGGGGDESMEALAGDPTGSGGVGEMVFIPSGSYPFGSDLHKDKGRYHREEEDNTPKHLGSFYIDKYEYPNTKGVRPMVNVTWGEADRICREAGKRLCTEEEWEAACEGRRGKIYGYDDAFDPSACNWSGAGKGTIAKSGSKRRCESPFGTFDMPGNVAEWTSGEWDIGKKPHLKVARSGAFNNRERVLRCANRIPKGLEVAQPNIGFRCCRDAS